MEASICEYMNIYSTSNWLHRKGFQTLPSGKEIEIQDHLFQNQDASSGT
jgi:hypothetical protein